MACRDETTLGEEWVGSGGDETGEMPRVGEIKQLTRNDLSAQTRVNTIPILEEM
jgi:hypothetical protein